MPRACRYRSTRWRDRALAFSEMACVPCKPVWPQAPIRKNCPGCIAGGIGGQAKTLGVAEMPIGIAGVFGLCFFFVVLEDPTP